MTKQAVSKELLKIHRALGVLMANIILFGAMAVLFSLVSASSVIITGVITGVLVYGYMEVKKGKSRGFKWAAMINGMMGAATLWYMWLVRSGATPMLIMIAVVVVVAAAAFATVFYLGLKAFDGVSSKIDLDQLRICKKNLFNTNLWLKSTIMSIYKLFIMQQTECSCENILKIFSKVNQIQALLKRLE